MVDSLYTEWTHSTNEATCIYNRNNQDDISNMMILSLCAQDFLVDTSKRFVLWTILNYSIWYEKNSLKLITGLIIAEKIIYSIQNIYNIL